MEWLGPDNKLVSADKFPSLTASRLLMFRLLALDRRQEPYARSRELDGQVVVERRDRAKHSLQRRWSEDSQLRFGTGRFGDRFARIPDRGLGR